MFRHIENLKKMTEISVWVWICIKTRTKKTPTQP